MHRPFFICVRCCVDISTVEREPVERGILVPLWLCCLTPYTSRYSALARTYYFADLTPWNAKRHLYQLAFIIYSSPTVPRRPRHIAFSHLDLSVSQKNRTPPFFRNSTVRISHFTSCLQSAHTTHIPELLTHILFDLSYPLRASCDRTCTRRLGKAHKEGGPDLKRSGRAPDL